MQEGLIKRISMEEGAIRYDLAKTVLGNLPGIPVQEAKDAGERLEPNDSAMGKETIHLLPYKGEFLKPCPGTKEYICCGYQILNLGTNCPLDCSYCILQAYINQPHLRVFVNLEEGLEQALQQIDRQPDRIFRIGTGEFTDSLAIDHITRWSERLLPLFSTRRNVVLELKTKTSRVKGVLDSKYRDRIILSWSLNSPYICLHEEKMAAGLRKRLEAARQCQSEGFTLGFHFDPLIQHRGWKDEYLKTLDLMDKYIDPKGIIWISLGSFRFMPGLKPIIRRRHPETCVLDGEFVVGLDGKMRYFRPIRVDLYGHIRENLEKWHSNLGLYLCMESDHVWQSSMRWSPTKTAGLSNYLDSRVLEFFCSNS
jgi:spore photoproduct lyase